MAQAFVSFDLDHDNDRKRRPVDDVTRARSHSAVDDWSIRELADDGQDKAHTRISNVDLTSVMRGEHTDSAPDVDDDVAIARDVGTPYLVIAGRPVPPEPTCRTRPRSCPRLEIGNAMVAGRYRARHDPLSRTGPRNSPVGPNDTSTLSLGVRTGTAQLGYASLCR